MKWSEEKLKEVMRNGENSFVEFKGASVRAESIAKELVAFSNSNGGLLFIGINDNGEIEGLDKAKNMKSCCLT